MKGLIFIITILFSFLSQTIYADVLACPASTAFVNIGDDVATVINKCGPPQKKIVLKPERVKQVVVWQYALPGVVTYPNTNSFAFLFSNGQVRQILAGQTNISYLNCPNGGVPLGATMPIVQGACGAPYFKRIMRPHKGERYLHEPEIIKLIYKPRAYLPQTTFVFKDGSLFDKY